MEKPLTCCWYLLLINVVCSLLRTSSNSGAFVLSLSVSPRLSLLAAASDAAAEHNSNMQYMVKAAGSDKPHREAAVDVEESRQRPLQSSTEEFQYMSQIYYHRSQEILAGPSSGSQREGRCQRPESTVIHSYPFLGTKAQFLQFEVRQRKTREKLCHGTLRLHYQSDAAQEYWRPFHKRYRTPTVLRVDILARHAASNRTVFVASKAHSIKSREFSGWFEIDVSGALSLHSGHVADDYQLELLPIVTVYGTSNNRFTLTADPKSTSRPLLVVHNSINEDGRVDPSLLEALERAAYAPPLPTPTVAAAKGKEAIITEQPNWTVERNGSASRQRRGAFHRQCQLRRKLVPMSLLGLNNVVLPPFFPMTFCRGTCLHPIIHPTSSSLHGRVMALMHSVGQNRKQQAAEPCCAPSEVLEGIDMLFLWPNGGFMIRYYEDMIATGCECN